MTERSITFHLSEPRAALWCDTCALPSVYEFDVNHIKSDGVTTVGTIRRCPECQPLADREA